MLDTLRQLVAFRTVSGNHAAMSELLDYAADRLRTCGLHIEYIESDGFRSLAASTRLDRKHSRLMLSAHADVVPAGDDLFELTQADGKLYGRGVLDMKFAIAAYLQLAEDLRDKLDHYDFSITITPDEEIGGEHGLKAVMDAGYRADVCLLPDGGDNWQIQTASKGYWAFEISAAGRTGHASRPWLADNALDKLLLALRDIRRYLPAGTDTEANSLSLTCLSGGEAMNQIPGTASMTLDIRTISHAEHDRLYAAVAAVCRHHELTYAIISKSPPTSTDLAHRLIRPYVEAIQSTTGTIMEGWHAPATCDARYLTPLGIPFIAVYPTGGGHHSPLEWLDAKAFNDFYTVTRDYIDVIARIPTS